MDTLNKTILTLTLKHKKSIENILNYTYKSVEASIRFDRVAT